MSDETAAQMSIECPDCHGLIEMPVPATPAEELHCPHCGCMLRPRARAKLSAKRIAIWIAVFWALGVAGFLAAVGLRRATPPPAQPGVPEQAAAPSVSTNQFTVSGLTIEKQGTLSYAQGTARNDLPRQRFGVTIQLELLDTNELRVGSASDYRAVVHSNEVWRFRALVVEPSAVSAGLMSIQEDR